MLEVVTYLMQWMQSQQKEGQCCSMIGWCWVSSISVVEKTPFLVKSEKVLFLVQSNQLQRGDSVCDKTNQTSATNDQPSRTNCNSQSVSEKKERSPRLSSVCSKFVFRDRSLVLSLNCCFSQCWDPLSSSSPSGWFLFVLWVVSVPVGQRGEGETSVPDDWTAVDLWINKQKNPHRLSMIVFD